MDSSWHKWRKDWAIKVLEKPTGPPHWVRGLRRGQKSLPINLTSNESLTWQNSSSCGLGCLNEHPVLYFGSGVIFCWFSCSREYAASQESWVRTRLCAHNCVDLFYKKLEQWLASPLGLRLSDPLVLFPVVHFNVAHTCSAHNPIGLCVIQIPARAAQADIHVGRIRICRWCPVEAKKCSAWQWGTLPCTHCSNTQMSLSYFYTASHADIRQS